MKALLSSLTANLPGPTEEELEQARQELMDYTKINPSKGYVSKNPDVFKLQVRAWAYGIGLRVTKQAFAVDAPAVSPEQIEEDLNKKQMLHDYEVCRVMMGADSIYSQVSFYNPATIDTAVVKYLKEVFPYSGKNGCLLLGGTGSGKTFGAIGYVVQYATVTQPAIGDPFANAAFITAYKLSELLSRRQFESLERMEKLKYLIIDDLGTEPEGFKGKDFIAHFENLFISRHQHRKTTIMTSNLTLEQVISAYGDRFVSRLRETGAVFQTSDPDLRAIHG